MININFKSNKLYDTYNTKIKNNIQECKKEQKEYKIPSKSNLYSPKDNELGILKSNIQKNYLFINPEINPDVFFIRMFSYRKNNPEWAAKMCDCTLETSKIIGLEDFETILRNIENQVKKMNNNDRFGERRETAPGFFSIFEDSRGQEYFDKYLEAINSKRLESLKITSPEQFKNANTVEIIAANDKISIRYGHLRYSEDTNLDYIKEVYEDLINTKNPSLETILEKTATIRWLFNQEQPYWRGNESIIGILERAIFHHYGIESTPYKKYTSPDFEVFYRNLDEFIKVYPGLFEKKPEFKTQA